jgi:hypothetical protein
MQPTTFLFLAFGSNANNHAMGTFSILSLKKFAPANSRFVIYTDKPDCYKYLSSIAETRLLDEKKLIEWQGKHNFVWRIKLMAMLDSAYKDAGHLVYMDTDTFAMGNLDTMIEKLESGSCFMHVRESLLCEDKAANKRLMWKQTKDNIFGGMAVNDTTAMWNAGVVGVDQYSKIELINKALMSTDQMCEKNVERWLIEQLSLSQALSSTRKLEAADEWIAHYWGNKEDLTKNIHLFLSNLLQRMQSIDQAVALIDVKHWKTFLVPKTEKPFFQKWFHQV